MYLPNVNNSERKVTKKSAKRDYFFTLFYINKKNLFCVLFDYNFVGCNGVCFIVV